MGRKKRKQPRLAQTQRRPSPVREQWPIMDRMRWARDAHYFGATEYALEVLMEIAQEEINNHVQETFDLSCQPRPVRKGQSKKPKIRSHFSDSSHSSGVRHTVSRGLDRDRWQDGD